MLSHPGSTPSGASARPLVTVMLIESREEEAESLSEFLVEQIPGVGVVHAHSVADAKDAGSRASIDLVIACHSLSDGNAGDVLATAEEYLDAAPVIVYVDGDREEVERIRETHVDLLRCESRSSDRGYLSDSTQQFVRALVRIKRKSTITPPPSTDILRRVRHTISRVNHDLNNPLSIISGNAQLLVELARAYDLDGDLMQPIQDIEEASARVAGILRRLIDLRDQLPVDEEANVRSELSQLEAERHGGR